MKRTIIILLITLIILLLFNSFKSNTTTIDYNKTLKNELSKINYFHKKNLERYISYYDNNPELTLEDVVIRVNLNLDKSFYTNTVKSNLLNKDYILVNKYIYLSDDYVPNNLVKAKPEYSREGMMLVDEALLSFEKMYQAAKNDGYKIRIMSSFRSYQYQVNLYNKYVKDDGVEAADKYSARPGFSEHQTGLCVDIDDGVINYQAFEKSRSYIWMKNNSYKYGFIERYPKDKEKITGYSYESWHYRYVGEKIATYIHDHNITFDEYFAMFIQK